MAYTGMACNHMACEWLIFVNTCYLKTYTFLHEMNLKIAPAVCVTPAVFKQRFM